MRVGMFHAKVNMSCQSTQQLRDERPHVPTGALVACLVIWSGMASCAYPDLPPLASQPNIVDDSFTVVTTNSCGSVEFIDAASRGSGNEDYLIVHDLCNDAHGVRASGSLNNVALEAQYNGSGLCGPPVFWHPFPSGHLNPGDTLTLKVCLVDGSNDASPTGCGSATQDITDG